MAFVWHFFTFSTRSIAKFHANLSPKSLKNYFLSTVLHCSTSDCQVSTLTMRVSLPRYSVPSSLRCRKLFRNSKKKQTLSSAFASGKTEIYFFSSSSFFQLTEIVILLRNHIYMCFVAANSCTVVHGMVYGWFWTIHLFHFTMYMLFKEFSFSPSSSSPYNSPSRQLICSYNTKNGWKIGKMWKSLGFDFGSSWIHYEFVVNSKFSFTVASNRGLKLEKPLTFKASTFFHNLRRFISTTLY